MRVRFNLKILLVLTLVGLFLSCEKTEKTTNKTIYASGNVKDCAFVILKVESGKKVKPEDGSKPYCEGTKKTCWLWFLPCEEGIVPTATITSTLNNELKVTLLFDELSSIEQSKWAEAISSNLLELTDDVLIDDVNILSLIHENNSITIPIGNYNIISNEDRTYTIYLPYIK